jgi:hypothetical protein
LRGKCDELHRLNAQIADQTERFERLLFERGLRRPIAVPYRWEMQFAWSRSRGGFWRFVIRDGDYVDPLRSLSFDDVLDVWDTGAMHRLLRAAIVELGLR